MREIPQPGPKTGVPPRNFRRIRLELAREPSRPAGDPRVGYLLIAPLDTDDRIDAAGWARDKNHCAVIRYRPGEEPMHGQLVKVGKGWRFRYGEEKNEADELGYHFADERFMIGEYVSIAEADGMHTYRIAAVEHV
jgi:hypothetical protein